MQVQLLKSKIHRAQVTGGHVDYEGMCLTIAGVIMEKVGLYRMNAYCAATWPTITG